MHRDRRDQDVADDGHGRRVGHPALTRQSRPLVPAQVRCQIDDAVLAEARHLSPGLRVERDEHVAVHDDKDPLVARAVRPVADAAARGSRERIDDVEPSQQLSGRAPVPQQLAGGGIECHDIAIDARRRVHHAIDDQGTDLHLVRRPRTEVPRRPAPGHAKIADVGGIDLICGRIPRRTGVAAEEPPFGVALGRAGTALPGQGGRQSRSPTRGRQRPKALSLSTGTFRAPSRRQSYSSVRSRYSRRADCQQRSSDSGCIYLNRLTLHHSSGNVSESAGDASGPREGQKPTYFDFEFRQPSFGPMCGLRAFDERRSHVD